MSRISKYIIPIIAFLTLTHPVSAQSADLYKVEKVAVSTSDYNEIAPVIRENGILFCSDKRISNLKNITTYNDERLFNVYMATRKDSLRWNEPEKIKSTGSQLLYFGPLSIASDNKTVYFTSSVLSGKAAKKKGNNPRGIFIGELSGMDIINITPFRYNDNAYKYSVAHPSISRDGKYLYFASDMPGGQGGSDIYYCENINGQWGNPVNLGKKVNSPSKENYPYIHPSGRLYFSSDRPGNADYLGGMDVYYTSLYYGEWDAPAPMPAPINSKADDFAFVAEDNFKTGYFSRKTGNNDDILSYSSMIIRKISCDTLEINSYLYGFEEENAIRYDTMQVPFIYQWNFGDGDTAKGVKVQHRFKGPGSYLIRLDVFNTITKKIEANVKTENLEITDYEQPYISAPDTWNAGQPVKLSADSTNLPGWNVSQFYWNFGDESIEIGKNVAHTYLRPGTYNIQLIVTGTKETDSAVREACVSKNIIVIREP